MVLAAIDAGLGILGFSCHNYAGLDFITYQMKKENVDAYFDEISHMQYKYGDRIRIYKGLEVESRNGWDSPASADPRCDYSIGSVHYFKIDDAFYSVDSSPEKFMKALEAVGGDITRLWRTYFEEVAGYATQSDYDITGHIDLISKFNEKMHLFDESDPHYIDMALQALDCAIDRNKIIEINCGAIASGWKTVPYPAPFLLKRMKKRNARTIISSDAHHTSAIVQSYEKARRLLSDFGFTERTILTDTGFEQTSL